MDVFNNIEILASFDSYKRNRVAALEAEMTTFERSFSRPSLIRGIANLAHDFEISTFEVKHV